MCNLSLASPAFSNDFHPIATGQFSPLLLVPSSKVVVVNRLNIHLRKLSRTDIVAHENQIEAVSVCADKPIPFGAGHSHKGERACSAKVVRQTRVVAGAELWIVRNTQGAIGWNGVVGFDNQYPRGYFSYLLPNPEVISINIDREQINLPFDATGGQKTVYVLPSDPGPLERRRKLKSGREPFEKTDTLPYPLRATIK